MKIIRKFVVAAALLPLLAVVASGQALPPLRVTGTVVSLHGRKLVVKSAAGKNVSVSVPANARIIESVKASLADIKQGDFIGSAAVKQAKGGGVLRAQEVHIFPASMRGAGEGHRPMGPNPNRTMTNGNVAAIRSPATRSMTNGTVSRVSGSASKVMTVTYKGGQQRIEVGPSTPVTKIVSGSEALLKPGVNVMIFAARTKAGVTARMISVQSAPRNPRNKR